MESAQPVAGSLEAIVLRACRQPECKWYAEITCPFHCTREDLGVVASFDNRTVPDGKG